ncbi:MAG TPA: nuclear transport factor 2 family protein [Gemmatimonadales bacterium]|jgi:ketosteroid isomerase-like protein|nr:nuclear transport factor 2 family protein [Gemmatimonadales bacterium]
MLRRATFPLAALLVAAACTPKPAESGTMATVDTAAVKTELEALRGRYIAARTANDPAALAALYAEDAGVDLFGVPRLRGRASIEAAFRADSLRKYTGLEIMPIGMEARTNTDASELGTYHEMTDSMGTKAHAWGRYLVAFSKDSVGQWRVIYLIGFPDSTKVEK